VRVPRPLPTVQSDPILLGELFMNLLTNALKYNDKTEKWVEVGVVETGDRRHETGDTRQETRDRETGDRETGDRETRDWETGDGVAASVEQGFPITDPVSRVSCLVSRVSCLLSPVFYVRDNGIGIPLERQKEIFQIFRRLHERGAYGGGVGAGLTIAQQIVERHGGRLWLESTPGMGTTFYFTVAGER
jgi:signal transduction histidine kinase